MRYVCVRGFGWFGWVIRGRVGWRHTCVCTCLLSMVWLVWLVIMGSDAYMHMSVETHRTDFQTNRMYNWPAKEVHIIVVTDGSRCVLLCVVPVPFVPSLSRLIHSPHNPPHPKHLPHNNSLQPPNPPNTKHIKI